MKNLLILVLSIVCVYLFFFRKSETIVEKIPYEVKETVEVEVGRINRKIDAEGFNHAVISEMENQIKGYKQLTDSAKIEIDSITKLLGIKQNQLNQYVSYSATLEDSLLKVTHKTDTSIIYKDKYANIEFIPRYEHFNFSYNANVNYATYSKRDWFLGRKKDYIDFWISDPRATINGVKRLKIEQKENFFKVDVNAGAYYTNQLNAGFDGGVHFGRMRLGAGYFYDTSENEWRPVFTAKYNLLDF